MTPHPSPEPAPAAPGTPAPAPTVRRPRRRAVRPGAGDPDPSVVQRAPDDLDVGWQPSDDTNDDRLRRDVPPHW